MKVAIVTMEVRAGHCEENVSYMQKQIYKAKKDKADLILFPQNCISGYVGEAFKDEEYCQYLDHFNAELIKESDDIAIVWGNVKYRGGKLFNCAFMAYQGDTYLRVRKNDGHSIFDDDVFSSLDINSAISFHDDVLALNFQKELQLADWNINLDAHAYDIHDHTQLHGNVIYVNAVGMQNVGKAVVMMEGGSAIYREGECLWQMPYGKSGYSLVEIDACKTQKPLERDCLDLLAQAIRGFDEQILGGKCPWIIGLSGGLDSSVSAALLAYALGKERLIGYGMSSSHNSTKTKQNARQVAEALDIEFHDGSIMPLVEATKDVLKEYGYEKVEGLALENIQARLRGHLLSSFASLHGGVVVNNGNKVENALGYCTLYGDAIGALGILGDLTKVQLFTLSKELNRRLGKEAVPENLLPQMIDGKIVFEVAPSAELKNDQVDPMKWFYHDYLVDHLGRDLTITKLLKSYLDQSLLKGELHDVMKFYHLDQPEAFIADLQWFLSTAKRNLFKHTQVPVILSVSQNAYAFRKEVQGFDDKESYQELITKIKELENQ